MSRILDRDVHVAVAGGKQDADPASFFGVLERVLYDV